MNEVNIRPSRGKKYNSQRFKDISIDTPHFLKIGSGEISPLEGVNFHILQCYVFILLRHLYLKGTF